MKTKNLDYFFMKRIQEMSDECRREIIPFPRVFEKLCRNFSINKGECWELLFALREQKLIDIVPFHGIKIARK